MSPAELVQAQLDAYNAHDVEALVRCYHPGAEQYAYPDRLLAQGHEALRTRMAARFAASRPQATLLNRIVLGELVIDHERIEQQTPEGLAVVELVALYEVASGQQGSESGSERGSESPPGADAPTIRRARFIFGETRPASS